MRDNVLSHYSEKTSRLDAAAAAEAEANLDLGSFGWLRGIRDFSRTLQLRKKTGIIRAVSYAWIEQFEFDPSSGILLRVQGQSVRIKGRNLNTEFRPHVRLFDGICRHRVPWVQEADEPTSIAAGDKATVIEAIEW
jgi:hypothetical protein